MRPKMPSKFKNLSYYFTEYSENTSIHGIKFLGERKRSIFEKLFWLVIINLALYFCIDLCHKTYTKWRDSPVMVSFATSETPIWKIPFPAVTICLVIKAHRTKYDIEGKVRKWENNSATPEDVLTWNYFSTVCPKHEEVTYIKAFSELEDEMIDFLVKIAPNASSIFYACKWFGRSCGDISEAFAPLVTNGGICYTFNMLDRLDMFTDEAYVSYYERLQVLHQPRSEWSLEEGYTDKSYLETFPRRSFQIGTNGGLEVVLRTFVEDINDRCDDVVSGFKVILHHPAEVPRFQQRYFWVPTNQLVSVSVKPNMITTALSLQQYSAEDRKCYFINEKNLKYFKVYNQQNCILECLTNYTYKVCGCVKFHMPRNSAMPICGPEKLQCTVDASNNFLTRDIIYVKRKSVRKMSLLSTVKVLVKKSQNSNKPVCNCLPSCYSLNFDAETSQLDWSPFYLNDPYNETFSINYSKLRVYFKDMQFMTSERNELYGKTEFLANCGGLLGLFTGFSIISLVEIVYFVTLRLICNVRSYGWKNWSGSDKLREVTNLLDVDRRN